MNFVTHNDGNIDIVGTSLQGYLEDVSYEELLRVFGQPGGGDFHKVDAQWEIQFEDGDGPVATIYNWQNGPNYCNAEEATPVHKIRNWHIGGFDNEVLSLIQLAFQGDITHAEFTCPHGEVNFREDAAHPECEEKNETDNS